MFLSNNEMVPLSGFRAPVSRLNSVLFPLPFGPMMPTISACSTAERDTVDRADAAEGAE